ncbi:MAG: SDR family oxidoreductase [Candidatus Marinimicrobia bacterium]|nr:SDR family oxidoreductase [Candidatus Neomarinimicrobiota bacterium]
MRVFIIGASGLVGGNCMRRMQKEAEMEVIGSHFTFATNDTEYFNVFEPGSATFDLKAFAPQVIIHTGALTHVDRCETHPEESYRHTVRSAAAVLTLAKQYRSKLVYISSDYVFDGKAGPYSEEDRVNPLNVYGKHKLEAEQMVREEYPDSLILRVTNVYGDEIRGKNFVAFLTRTAQKHEAKTLRLPKDQYATPVDAWDIARAGLRLIRDDRRGLYHIAPDEYLSRVELAEKVLKYFPKARVNIEALPTSRLGTGGPAAPPGRVAER